MVSFELTGEGVRLTPLTVGDADALHAIWTAEPVRRFLWDGEIIAVGKTREILEENQRRFEESGYGIWGARDVGTDALVGFAGLWHFREPPVLELLFGVATEFWGRGLATESARRVVAYAFDELGFDVVDASTDTDNAASVKVLEKLGMTRTRHEVVDGLDTVFYSIRRDV